MEERAAAWVVTEEMVAVSLILPVPISSAEILCESEIRNPGVSPHETLTVASLKSDTLSSSGFKVLNPSVGKS